jgi:hypothetical protein
MAAPVAALRAVRMARRIAPLAAEAYRRWNALTPAEKERYKRRAREYGERGRDAGLRLFALLQQQRKKKR